MTTKDTQLQPADEGRLERGVRPLSPPWRIEARANPFVLWMTMGHFHRLEVACAKLPEVKRWGQ